MADGRAYLITRKGLSYYTQKNPAYGRQRISRPMRIVGSIQFWRGCVIYPEMNGCVGELVHAPLVQELVYASVAHAWSVHLITRVEP